MKNEIKLRKFEIREAVTGFLFAPYELYQTTTASEHRMAKTWFTLGWVTLLTTAVGLLIAALFL